MLTSQLVTPSHVVVTLSAYIFQPLSRQTFSSPFDQYSFPLFDVLPPTSLNDPNNPNRVSLTFATQIDRFTKNTINGTTPGLPNLTTRLTSGDVSLYLAQGCPYMVIQPDTVTGLNIIVATSIMNPFPGATTGIIPVNTQKSYAYAIFWNNSQKENGVVFMFDSTITYFAYEYGIEFINTNLPIYVTLIKTIGALEPITSVLTTFVQYLNPPIFTIQDILVSSGGISNTLIQYQSVYQMNTYGVMWIVPESVATVNGLVEFPNTTTAFGFPTGRGLFIAPGTLSQTTNNPISFYTIWETITSIPSDFSYKLSYDHLANNSTDINLATANDMYELSIALRVRVDNEKDLNVEQLSGCITFWINELNDLLYNEEYNVMYTKPNTLRTEVGLISKFAYILLTYINLYNICISGLLPTSASPYLIIMSEHVRQKITAIIDTSLVTVNPILSSPRLTCIPYFDFYNSTFVNIDTDNSMSPSRYYSRFGETLAYMWACNYIIRNILLLPGSPVALLSGSLLSICSQSNMSLLRADCSWISVSKNLPWNGLYTDTMIGFQRDPKSILTLGNSPDAVFIESAIPFSPVSQMIIRPVHFQLRTAYHKMLRCAFPIESSINHSVFSFGDGMMDPVWAYFALYLFDDADDSDLFTNNIIPSHLTNFVSSSKAKYKLVALLMNARKTIIK